MIQCRIITFTGEYSQIPIENAFFREEARMNKTILLLVLFAVPAGIARNPLAVDKVTLLGNVQSFAVVELFTSEGCSSCPSADRLLGNIVEEARQRHQPVFALAYHVDYWNHLGWKDIYSRASFSRRQQQYARALDASSIYTPQMIVNGSHPFVGSDEIEARAFIKKALARDISAYINFGLHLDRARKELTIRYEIAGIRCWGAIQVRVALVERGLKRAIKSGENRGRILYHENVVRSFMSRGAVGPSSKFSLPIPEGVNPINSSLILFIQENHSMEILAAAGKDLTG